ncbi:MAG: tetratricopeptide repeat protein [Kiritimatiellae bacterium]|nr:tetratricopeptide repeat protein [Kiritimatiellia bacterium]
MLAKDHCFFTRKSRKHQKNEAEASLWFRKAAEKGYAQAQFEIGYRYEKGNGVEKNEEEAMKWYRKAAEQGHAAAQAQIATSQSVTE